jgi:hypothetical protein
MNLLVDIRGAQKLRKHGISRYIQNLIFSLLEKKSQKITLLIDSGQEQPIWFEELWQSCNVIEIYNYKTPELEQFSISNFVKKIDYLGAPEGIST